MSVATFDARVIAAFGRHLLVQEASGRTLKARPFGRDLGAVCGDDVRCRNDPHHGEVHVIEVLPRRTALYRSNARGGVEPVLANISRLLIVIAPVPPPDPFVADRYLAAAESAGIAATPVLNKAELGTDAALRGQLDVYAAVGYELMTVSAATGEGVDALLSACAGQVAALVGQSGVGKSSLIGRLVPDAEVQIGDLMREEEGRHTTTVSRLYDLPAGGRLIDSPGVRDFAPAVDHLDPRHLGFVEVARLAPGCRFLDCRHMREPGCAVQQGVQSGSMDPRRYESYRRLRRLAEELTAVRGPKQRR
ncbi:MAG TPA: ribosome small subunit-dependent GTPase A [Steroidobacteraceae bacterium]|nr:ribosome small subunit-dependent GTPase A [Steroidobacteraceae bacterium]